MQELESLAHAVQPSYRHKRDVPKFLCATSLLLMLWSMSVFQPGDTAGALLAMHRDEADRRP